MKVLFFCNLATGKLGAFEHLLLAIGKRLVDEGDRLIVIFGAPPSGPVPEALKAAGILWGHIEGWAGHDGRSSAWRFVFPALLAIREHKPDLVAVHFGNELPVLVASFFSRFLPGKTPVWVWHQRQQIIDLSHVSPRRILSRIRLMALGVDHCVVSYEGGRESLLARLVNPRSISRIYNGVTNYEPRRAQGWLRQELSLPEDTVLAVNVGWLVPRKRIEITLRAFAGVAQKIPHAVLLLVGDGPEHAALEALARKLNVATRVRFLGQRTDVREIMAECDCLVHSSIAETCTNVVIESMAAGIPAVVMDAGAAREMIADGLSGSVVGPHDEQALADRLEEVMVNRQQRKRMGHAACQRWREFFNLDHTAVEHCELYRRLAGMKTLFFCNLIPLKLGALEKALAGIAQEFKNAGDEFVVVFSREPIAPVAELLRSNGARWHVLKEWADGPGQVRPWGYVFPALHLLRVERPDVAVVHFGNEIPTGVTILLSRLLGMGRIKWVWQQDQQIQDPGRVAKCVSRIRLLSLVADHFVAAYEGGRASCRKRGIPMEKITVIRNSVSRYHPARPANWLRQELGIGAEDVILTTIGSLIPRKRIDFILRCCAAHCPEGASSGCSVANNVTPVLPPWRLLVIGDGPEREQLALLAQELGIASRVHLLGLRNDVREILAVSDIYVHAASAEACPYAITESMAAGIPAVVLDAGAAKEQVENGVSGYVLEDADQAVFSARLQGLMADVEKRAEMGRRAETRWRNRFTLEATAPEYHRLYRRLGVP
jgi:glycosyltransferase involved in cell wall biosynthesis